MGETISSSSSRSSKQERLQQALNVKKEKANAKTKVKALRKKAKKYNKGIKYTVAWYYKRLLKKHFVFISNQVKFKARISLVLSQLLDVACASANKVLINKFNYLLFGSERVSYAAIDSSISSFYSVARLDAPACLTSFYYSIISNFVLYTENNFAGTDKVTVFMENIKYDKVKKIYALLGNANKSYLSYDRKNMSLSVCKMNAAELGVITEYVSLFYYYYYYLCAKDTAHSLLNGLVLDTLYTKKKNRFTI